jgi:hypothetical protein
MKTYIIIFSLLSVAAAYPRTRSSTCVERKFDPNVDLYANWPPYDALPLDPSYPTKAAWGVWGAEDEHGALNHITKETVLAASQTI